MLNNPLLLTPEQVIKFLDDLLKGPYDTEGGHLYADAILCAVLNHLGYAEISAKFAQLDKWYA